MVGDNGTESKYRGSTVFSIYALGALTAKKAESVGVSALLPEKSGKLGTGFWHGRKAADRKCECRGIKKIQCVFYRGYNTEYDLSDI